MVAIVGDSEVKGWLSHAMAS